MPQGNPRPGELYCHFKQKMYQILTVAEHSETGEPLVIYQALYGKFQTYARPLKMFISPVEQEKYPQMGQQYRFQLINMQTAPEQDSLKAAEPKTMQQPAQPQEQLMAFLDADTMEEKYKILTAMESGITDHMINNMAVVLDLVIEDGPVGQRFEELKRCLGTVQKYESVRLR